jgi:hypothetical protein
LQTAIHDRAPDIFIHRLILLSSMRPWSIRDSIECGFYTTAQPAQWRNFSGGPDDP